MKYRKKPVVVEAFSWTPAMKTSAYPEWLQEALASRRVWYYGDKDSGIIFIETLEGRMIVNPHDYIIQGVKGELYPCKPDIFEQTYEPVELREAKETFCGNSCLECSHLYCEDCDPVSRSMRRDD